MKNIIAVMVILGLVSVYFLVQGINMHVNVSNEEAKFHEIQGDYFNIRKITRDNAPEGSELNKQLIEIKNYPSELLRLKLVGVGKILTGIYILLLGILIALLMMPVRLGKIIKGKK